MNNEQLIMFDKKRIFLMNLLKALMSDPRSGVVDLEYKANVIDAQANYVDEHITIHFEGGEQRTILTTANSNMANMMAIGKEIMKG